MMRHKAEQIVAKRRQAGFGRICADETRWSGNTVRADETADNIGNLRVFRGKRRIAVMAEWTKAAVMKSAALFP